MQIEKLYTMWSVKSSEAKVMELTNSRVTKFYCGNCKEHGHIAILENIIQSKNNLINNKDDVIDTKDLLIRSLQEQVNQLKKEILLTI